MIKTYLKMNKEITVAITQSLKYYVDKDISGAQLSKSISKNFESAIDLDKNQQRTFRYYIDFFEKEGKELFLDPNKYLKEEVMELREFLDTLASD